MVPKTCFQGHLGDVLRISWGCPKSTFQERPFDMRLGRPQDAILRRPQDVRSERPWDVSSGRLLKGQKGSLGNFLRTLEGSILGMSWGPVFAGLDVIHVIRQDILDQPREYILLDFFH